MYFPKPLPATSQTTPGAHQVAAPEGLASLNKFCVTGTIEERCWWLMATEVHIFRNHVHLLQGLHVHPWQAQVHPQICSLASPLDWSRSTLSQDKDASAHLVLLQQPHPAAVLQCKQEISHFHIRACVMTRTNRVLQQFTHIQHLTGPSVQTTGSVISRMVPLDDRAHQQFT